MKELESLVDGTNMTPSPSRLLSWKETFLYMLSCICCQILDCPSLALLSLLSNLLRLHSLILHSL